MIVLSYLVFHSIEQDEQITQLKLDIANMQLQYDYDYNKLEEIK